MSDSKELIQNIIEPLKIHGRRIKELKEICDLAEGRLLWLAIKSLVAAGFGTTEQSVLNILNKIIDEGKG